MYVRSASLEPSPVCVLLGGSKTSEPLQHELSALLLRMHVGAEHRVGPFKVWRALCKRYGQSRQDWSWVERLRFRLFG